MGPLKQTLRQQAMLLLDKAEVRGVGVVRNPPDAADRVRAEIAACPDPTRRAELETVLADLTR